MYKITFYVPESHKEKVKDAVFSAGAGRVGHYDSCSFEVLGLGQFRPLAGSKPFVGKIGVLERITEYKVEMIVADKNMKAAVKALKEAHPYESPSYDVFKLEIVG
ncbi:MAG: NGG1p interacting factor NIF3 [Bacteriovoracaceae bacterium]